MAKKPYVFISYSSKDELAVNRLVEILDEMNIAYWKAPQMIPAGSNYAREIPKAISECEVFLLVLSKRAQGSIWVEKEIDSAVCNRRTIIPFQIDEEPLNEMFRFYLNNVQTISFYRRQEQAIAQLRRQLQKLFGLEIVEDEKIFFKSVEEQRPQSEDLGRLGLEELAQFQTKSKRKKTPQSLVADLEVNECEYCGGNVEWISRGIYRCLECDRENYDSYQKIRNYLEEHGPTPAITISKDTGVPRKLIDFYFRDESLEIPSHSKIRVPCEKCGAPIRTGVYCEACKQQMGKTPKMNVGAWHTSRKRY